MHSIKSLIYILAVALFSCSSSESNHLVSNKEKLKAEGDSAKINELEIVAVSDSTLIRLPNGISLHWDNKLSQIVDDSLFSVVSAAFLERRISFIDMILDTTKTQAQAKACGVNRNLLIGGISFLLIRKIKDMPYFKVLGMQWDAFDTDCPYPLGMLDYINENRDEVRKKVRAYMLLNK